MMKRSMGLITGAGAVVAVGALVLLGLQQQADAPTAEGTAPPVAKDTEPARTAERPAEERQSSTETSAPARDDNGAPAPRIDTLRIEPDGMTLISGLTAPDETVEVALGDAIVASGRSGPDGSFVLFGDVPDTARPGALELRSTSSDGAVRRGTQTFIVEPPRPLADMAELTPDRTTTAHANDTSEAASGFPSGMGTASAPRATARVADDRGLDEPAASPGASRTGHTDIASSDRMGMATEGGDTDAEPSLRSIAMADTADRIAASDTPQAQDSVTDRAAIAPNMEAPALESPDAPSAQAASGPGATDAPTTGGHADRFTVVALAETTVPEPQAPRVLQVGDGGLSVLQGGPSASLSIDSISYATDGGTVLGGRAPGDTAVRVYLNNAPVDATRSGSDGQWRLDLPQLEERVYTLRVDQIGSDGSVVARAETPFKPEDATTLDALQATEQDGVRRVTVQPGFTLWAIAERNYGDGLEYVKVFEANAADIRDPDLIYPGQIFDVPE